MAWDIEFGTRSKRHKATSKPWVPPQATVLKSVYEKAADVPRIDLGRHVHRTFCSTSLPWRVQRQFSFELLPSLCRVLPPQYPVKADHQYLQVHDSSTGLTYKWSLCLHSTIPLSDTMCYSHSWARKGDKTAWQSSLDATKLCV
jgi:hypothetical protein